MCARPTCCPTWSRRPSSARALKRPAARRTRNRPQPPSMSPRAPAAGCRRRHRRWRRRSRCARGGEATSTMKSILLVDDEFGIVETLKELLESEGFKVSCASNGKDALARLATERPDLAVVDVMMPVMNGIEMLRAMRSNQQQRHVPVLLMSAVPKAGATQGAESLPH
ncbi:MAG: response regulator [Alphaproteobacteria bacterium]|nr:response regulator [Alphaproteobacteria bacterium]